MSRQDSLKSSGTTADVETDMHRPPALDPAVSLADYASSSVHAPEPVGRTLRALAERTFTGEAVFALGTGVRVYLDGGHPYYAERVGDAPLGERLVGAGVLAEHQLRQGMVRVGDVEHLGRLFDREASIDRDAVLAATELITDEVLSEIAPFDAAVEFTAYRHHRSGVHRWFVGPGRTAPLRPVDGVAQLDRSMFDSLPDVTASPAPSSVEPGGEPELIIEWDEPNPAGFAPPQPTRESAREPIADLTATGDVPTEARPALLPPLPPMPAPAALDANDTSATDTPAEGSQAAIGSVEPTEDAVGETAPPASFEVAPMSLESALASIEQAARPATGADIASDEPEPLVEAGAVSTPAAHPVDRSADEPDSEPNSAAAFTILWPDGSEQTTDVPSDVDSTVVPGPSTPPATTDGADTPTPVEDAPVAPVPTVDVPPSPAAPLLAAPEPVAEEPAAALEPVGFTMPPLRVDELPEPNVEVPDDVADAVRRALAAIERASVEPDVNARLRVGSVDLPDVSMPRLLDRSIVDDPVTSGSAQAERPSPTEATPPTSGTVPTSSAPAPTPSDADVEELTPTVIVGEPLIEAPMSSAPVPGVFAPPTADMSADAVYARLAAERAAQQEALPEPGQASVVFVEPETEREERKGALQRLIGSLRRR